MLRAVLNKSWKQYLKKKNSRCIATYLPSHKPSKENILGTAEEIWAKSIFISFVRKCNRKKFKLLFCLAPSSLPVLPLAGQTNQHDRAHSLFSLPHRPTLGQASQHDRAHAFLFASYQQDTPINVREHILSLPFLAAGNTSNEREHIHSSSLTLTTMRRTHPIYGPLVSGKSFFHHLSSLLNQRILGETNWIFSTPVLTSVF